MQSRPGRRRGGVLLITALVMCGIMLMWAVAATYRANFQSGATLYGFRKSEVYYLAKTGVSRALNQINTAPGWVAAHNSLDNADSTLAPGTLCWMEVSGSTQTLRCKATVGTQSTTLNVPLVKETSSDVHLYSITPALGGGPDVIAWTTTTAANWDSLPPIPGMQKVLSTAQTPNGDVFAVAQNPPNTDTPIWRYRKGQGWMELPSPPAGVSLASISAGGDDQLVCRGSNNAVMILPLGTNLNVAMNWQTVPPPTGLSLTNVAAHPAGQPQVCTSGLDGSGQAVLHRVDITNLYSGQSPTWNKLPDPTPAAYDATSGLGILPGAAVPNYDGGITVAKNGSIYAASNPAVGASVVYAYQDSTTTPGSWNWSALQPIPALNWTGQGTVVGTVSGKNLYGSGYATNISHLQADEKGGLWAQWTQPGSSEFSIISLPSVP